MKVLLALIVAICFSPNGTGYVLNRATTGQKIYWKKTKKVYFFLDSTNNSGISSSSIEEMLLKTKNQWDSYFPKEILIRNERSESIGRNNIFFDIDKSYIQGTGIVGLTQVIYNEDDGEIVEADIILNDKEYFFTDTPGVGYYLGDVLSHEMGHALGMGHGQVFDSTMAFEYRHGQDSIEADDLGGILDLYARQASDRGVVAGRVMGGASVPVFAARVSAISLSTGEVVAASVSDENGFFEVKGLPLGDTYYLYISPLKKTSLPSFYDVAKSDFCSGGGHYVGSFYSGCGNSDEGYPRGIDLSSGKVNVGVVTIKCNLESPPEYLAEKGIGVFELSSPDIVGNKIFIGESMIGYFFKDNLDGEIEDEYRMDLSGLTDLVDFENFDISGDYYLEVRVAHQTLFSGMRLQLEVTSPADPSFAASPLFITSDPEINGDGNPKIDPFVRIPIDLSDSSNNDFLIKVKPTGLVGYAASLAPAMTLRDFIPSPTQFLEELTFYFLSARVVKKEGVDSYSTVSKKRDHGKYSNAQCLDAGLTYRVLASSDPQKRRRTANEDELDILGAACGSIVTPPGSSGPGSGLMILLAGIAIMSFKRRSIS